MPLHKIFTFTIFLLAVFGLIMVASASGPRAQAEFGDSLHLFYRQLMGFAIGVAGFAFFYSVKLSWLRILLLPLLLVSIILLAAVFFPQFGGLYYNGSYRWLNIGPFSFQPSELGKLSLLFYGAGLLSSSKHKGDVTNFYKGFLPFVLISTPIPLLILAEPNVSNFAISTFIIAILLFVAGARISHMALLGFFGLCFTVLSLFIFPKPLSRILTFLNPQNDPQGSSYQINQSLISIGSGGIWGRGLGASVQKQKLLPEPAGDAIFAVIGEELGFIGSVGVVVAYLLLVLQGIIIASKTHDLFAQYIVTGFVSLVALQAFINISAVSGLMPLTGVTLPFISYGSTSLVSLMAASGVVAGIAKRAN